VKIKLATVLAIALLMVGCNTWKGFGQDVQKAGEKIEQSGSK
jgi:predicted small secreted protein